MYDPFLTYMDAGYLKSVLSLVCLTNCANILYDSKTILVTTVAFYFFTYHILFLRVMSAYQHLLNII